MTQHRRDILQLLGVVPVPIGTSVENFLEVENGAHVQTCGDTNNERIACVFDNMAKAIRSGAIGFTRMSVQASIEPEEIITQEMIIEFVHYPEIAVG